MAMMEPPRPGNWFRRQPAPVTIVLTALVVITSLATWANPAFMTEYFAFTGKAFPKVWTLLTYPFANFVLMSSWGPLSAFFLAMWLYSIGRTIETDHGSKLFIFLWIGITLVGVLPLAIFGYAALGTLLPVAMLTVMWGTRFQNSVVHLFGIVPVQGKWIAALSAATVFFTYASTGSQVFAGALALIGCVLAFLFASNRIPKIRYGLGYGTYVKPKPTRAQIAKEKQYFDDVYRREKEREEKERLRRMFEDSLGDDKK